MAPPVPHASIQPGLPRWVEALLASIGLVVFSPLLLGTALAVKLSSPGPVFFRQARVGRFGRHFPLYKFRSMRLHTPGQKFTAQGDARVTPVGRLIRKFKFDELPQLLNVLRGEMSFVGPRPEVPEYVDLEDPLWQKVLATRPGLTHPLTLLLHPEEELLAQVEGDSKQFYDRYFLPYKLHGYLGYLEERTAWSDLWTVVRTFWEIAVPHRADQPTAEEIERVVGLYQP